MTKVGMRGNYPQPYPHLALKIEIVDSCKLILFSFMGGGEWG